MLQSVEVLPDTRRSIRRSVHVECDVISEVWEEPVPHLMTDLSSHGVWIATPYPLPIGTEVALAFRPPRWRQQSEVVCFAVVRRTARGPISEPHTIGMGLELLDLSKRDKKALAIALRGLPPPLRSELRARKEMIWIDMLLTWEEDLGDRVNTFEVSELMGMVEDDEMQLESLAEPLAQSITYAA